MRTRLISLLVVIAVAMTAGLPLAAERSEIPEKYTWKIEDVFPSEAAFVQAKDRVAQKIPELKKLQGHLGDSPAALYDAITSILDLNRELDRLSMYTMMLKDQDTRVSASVDKDQMVDRLGVDFGTAVAFFRPEILSLGPDRVNKLIAGDKRLAMYRQFFDDLLRWLPHTLPADQELILAKAGNVLGAGGSVYSVFTNAEMPYPEITLSSGEKVRLDAAGYTLHRASSNRKDRKAVFEAFWNTYQQYRRTLAATLYEAVKTHEFNKDVRKYDSSLGASLFNYNIPTAVYKQLISDVHANLPTLHRYLKLRQKMLGVDHLRYEDLYAPLVAEADLEYTPEQAVELVVASAALLGPEYVEPLKKGFAERWVDFLPSTGKKSGAYSTGTYDVHPYQLQNFMGRYDDVSTIAHESGHSLHSWLSSKNQPYVYSGYSLFVAEVASTMGEHLLLNLSLANAKDDATRLFLLGSSLESARTTLFRQTLFAEFELLIHEMVAKGETLTDESLNKLYLGLLREYYGHDKDICKVDDLYQVEWAYIPHFYRNFYVFQYATSHTASTALAEAVLDEAAKKPASTKARDAYLGLLKGGSSKYPMELLKDAGVDMATSAPFQAAMRDMNRVMDQIEAILKRQGK